MEVVANKKKEVLFILHLPPPVHGAAVVNNYIKTSRLINENYNTDYVSLATNTVLAETGKGSLKKFFKFISILWKVFRKLISKKYDLCYMTLTASGPAFYKDIIVVALLKLFGQRIIYHFHNKGVAAAKDKGINNSLYRFAFNNTKSLLLSKYLYPDIKDFVKEENVYYCPCGVPESNAAELIYSKSIRAGRKLSILYLSNMMIEKGVYVLLEACAILKKRNLPFTCNFVGGWTDITPDEFNNYVEEHHLQNSVFAHGPKYGDDKVKFFQNADVFVFPTYYHYEAFPLVNLEAMQYSLPVISTTEAGIPDEIIDGETGFLIPRKDALMLADKLQFFIGSPEAGVYMGELGRQRFKSKFTLNHFEENISKIVSKAITEPIH